MNCFSTDTVSVVELCYVFVIMTTMTLMRVLMFSVWNDFREWPLLILEALVCAAVELYCALLRCVSNN